MDLYYVHQFLRRNEEYMQDWTDFLSDPRLEKAEAILKKWNDPFFWPSCLYLHGEAVKVYQEAAGKFLTGVINGAPGPEYDPIVTTQTGASGRRGSEFVLWDKENVPDVVTIKITAFRRYLTADSREKRAFRNRVIASINQQLEDWEIVSRKVGLHPTKPIERDRADQYDDYLTVWDLRQQGKKWAEIAREVFLDSKEHPEAAIQRAKDRYKRACQLIKQAARPPGERHLFWSGV